MKLEKAFKKSDAPVIVAHAEPGYDNIEILAFMCEATDTRVLLNNCMSPISPFTGGDLTPIATTTASVTEDEVKELVQIATCNDCGNHHSTEASIAAKIDGEDMHCIICGAEMTVDVDSFVISESEDEKDEKDEKDEDEKDEKEESSVETPVVEEKVTETATSDDKPTEVKVEVKEESTTEQKPADETVEKSTLEVSSHFALSDFSVEDVTLANSGDTSNTYYMFVKHVPIATLSRDLASVETAKIFSKDKVLKETLLAALSVNGFSDDVVRDFGIVSTTVKVEVDTAVAATIEAKTQEIADNYAKKEAEMFENFKQCASISAIGITKNTFKGTENSLREGLISEFKKVGVANASVIVDKVIKAEGENFVKSILAKAYELKDKPLEARNELAKMVENANFNYPTETVEVITHQAAVSSMVEETNVTSDSSYTALFNYSKKR